MSIAKVYPAETDYEPNIFNNEFPVTAGTGLLPPTSVPSSIVQTVAWTIPSLAAGANATQTFAIPGINAGDYTEFTMAPQTYLPDGIAVLATASAANTVTLNAYNNGSTTTPSASINAFIQVWAAGMIAAEEAINLKSR